MKIDIHSVVMGWLTSSCFYETAKEQLPKLVENYYKNKKVKRIQFYSDFYNTNGDYPYIKNDLVYYPLTIIFYNNSYEVLWVSWNYSGNKEKIHKLPFIVLDHISFNLCEDVEKDFKNSIKGKKLVYLKSKTKAVPVIKILESTGIGKVNQAFVDVLVEHIEKILYDKWNVSLSNRWDVNIYAEGKTIKMGNKKYRKVAVVDAIGYSIDFGVEWEENFDVSDFVAYDEINFSLVDAIPGEKIASVKKLVDFIKERTTANSNSEQRKGLGIWTKVD